MTFCECCCCYKKKSDKCRMTCATVSGVLLIIIGSVYMVIYNAIFYAATREQTEIREGTIVYPEWVAPDGDIVFCYFYFMNITNAEEFASQTPDKFVKPILKQTGPYIYKSVIKKDNIVPLDDLTPKEIRYRQTFNFYYDEEGTVESHDDVVSIINYLALAMGPAMDYVFNLPEAQNLTALQRQLAYQSLNRMIKTTNSSMLITATVKDILWGMDDPLYTTLVDNLETVLDQLGLSHLLPPLPEQVGLFARLNDSGGWHTYQSYTGDNEHELTNMITTVDNATKLDYWFGDTCNMINGSDGTLRPPFGKKEETIYHFYPSACRTTYVTYARDTTVKKIPGWEYRPPHEMFRAPSESDYNHCFCEENSQEPYCLNGGAQHLGQCYYGAPLMLSAPHFLHADEFYTSKVEGLNPNAEEHETLFVYEPNTGAALNVQKKLQFNLLVQPHNNIDLNKQLKETFACPIMWVNGTYLLTDGDATLIYASMVVIPIFMICLQAVMIATGVGLLAYVSYYYYYHVRNQEEKNNEDKKEDPYHFITDSKSTML